MLLADCHILFLLNECVFGVFGQYFASGGLQFTNDDLSWHYLVDEISHGHLDDLDTAQDMTPSDTIDDKLVNLLGSALEETPIVLAVVVRLVLSIWSTLLATNSWIIRFFTIIFLVQGAQHADDTLEEEQDVVEAVDFEFLEEGASKVLLILELLHEDAVRINLLQVLNNTDLLALIDLLIVFKKLLDNLFEHALLSSVF